MQLELVWEWECLICNQKDVFMEGMSLSRMLDERCGLSCVETPSGPKSVRYIHL